MLGAIIGLLFLAFTIYCIYDLWAKQNKENGTKILWTILLVIFGALAGVIYWFAVRNKN